MISKTIIKEQNWEKKRLLNSYDEEMKQISKLNNEVQK